MPMHLRHVLDRNVCATIRLTFYFAQMLDAVALNMVRFRSLALVLQGPGAGSIRISSAFCRLSLANAIGVVMQPAQVALLPIASCKDESSNVFSVQYAYLSTLDSKF